MTEDEMVGWHHQLDGHECKQTLGVGDGQGILACCSPWDHKELGTTKQLNELMVCHSFSSKEQISFKFVQFSHSVVSDSF